MPFKPGELRRPASSRRNAKNEAFRAGGGVKASRIPAYSKNNIYHRELQWKPAATVRKSTPEIGCKTHGRVRNLWRSDTPSQSRRHITGQGCGMPNPDEILGKKLKSKFFRVNFRKYPGVLNTVIHSICGRNGFNEADSRNYAEKLSTFRAYITKLAKY